MSAYSSLLSLSPVDQIGGYVDDVGGGGGGDDDDDMAVAASYLAFDIDVGEEYYPPEEAAAGYAFHSEQQAPAPAPFLASPQADSDSYKSGKAASSGGGAESSKLQSQWGGMAELSSQGLSNHDKIDMVLKTGGGAARSLARSRSSKIAFKTRSEVEVLDDGYRWRKYGKKMVKNSPNPRNYYRCLSEGCRVKKRVERERDDARFVITTYDGVHNHPAPLPPRGCAGYSLGQLSPWKAADSLT